MSNKTEQKSKTQKTTPNAGAKAKDLATKKSPKGGDTTWWGKLPNHNGTLLRVM